MPQRSCMLLLSLLLAACAPHEDTGSGIAAPVSPPVRGEGRTAVASAAADWPMYNRDYAGTRYSPLRQIDTDNVTRLARAWSYKLGRSTTSGELTGGSEFTPIAIAGVMYAAAADRVVALDAATGEEIWRYPMLDRAPPRRGLAYWPGDGNDRPRLLFAAGRALIALETADGTPARGFGDQGVVEMPVPYEGAPLVFENLVIVGSNGAPAGVRAFDARSGALAWEFLSVPKPGAAGSETWEREESLVEQRRIFSWAFSLTLDAERGIVYPVFESPGPIDYWGGNRPGDDLFGNSVVALDARTGERLWHYQIVHHDLWDYDIPAPPGLLDVTIDGASVPLLAIAGKTGYMYLLNRVTGEPVFGIEERAVPASEVPGERSSATQPIPVKPPPIARVSFRPEDIVSAADTNEAHARFCEALAARSGGLGPQGPFEPYPYRAPGSAARSIVLFPGSVGGANWGGTASDPTLGYVFVNTMDEASLGWVEDDPTGEHGGTGSSEGGPAPYRRNSAVGPLSRFQWSEGDPARGNILDAGAEAWPCQKPPWGSLVAVNAASGDIAWRVPLGVTDTLPPDKQHTGRLNMGGPITTAGGLVFIAATNDRRFRAFDSRSGEELWSAQLAASAHAVPITYLGRDGRQYVAVFAAGTSAIDDPVADDAQELVVYALP
jgi:quinoprotein glucose dehydrogenase